MDTLITSIAQNFPIAGVLLFVFILIRQDVKEIAVRVLDQQDRVLNLLEECMKEPTKQSGTAPETSTRP